MTGRIGAGHPASSEGPAAVSVLEWKCLKGG